jgi:hypothetical protein
MLRHRYRNNPETAVGREALPRLWPAPLLFLVKSCARQESCLSPKGEFSPDSRMSLRTTGKGRWSKKLPGPPPFQGAEVFSRWGTAGSQSVLAKPQSSNLRLCQDAFQKPRFSSVNEGTPRITAMSCTPFWVPVATRQ